MDNLNDKISDEAQIDSPSLHGIIKCYYFATPKLRYVRKIIPVGNGLGKYELRLQQMWRGTDGSDKWQWVEEVGDGEVEKEDFSPIDASLMSQVY